LFSLAMSFQSKAEVLLANTNTANGTTNWTFAKLESGLEK